MTVRGRDRGGFLFEESTLSENVCRGGAAFRILYDVTPGSDLEIRIPFAQYSSRHSQTDFATQGRVVHVSGETNGDGRLVGVQFIGPRFNRVFRSEAGL